MAVKVVLIVPHGRRGMADRRRAMPHPVFSKSAAGCNDRIWVLGDPCVLHGDIAAPTTSEALLPCCTHAHTRPP
jgi:hypothetical protein